jgi:hypothetical protein
MTIVLFLSMPNPRSWLFCARSSLVYFLWLIPIALMFVFLGQEHILTQMAWFFTKAALLTFGGAYAVLPYVYDGAVSTFSLDYAKSDVGRAGAR